MDEELIGQLGLILTQLRVTRRALEDVERSTARYHGLAFASALQRGPRFGEPPLFADALKVYVVNINDLAPGGGFGAFLEGLVGGLGRFFGGLFGGLVGGTLSGVALPVMLGQVERIARTLERITNRLLSGVAPAASEAQAAVAPPPAAAAPDMEAMLRDLRATADAFTGLFLAAQGEPEKAAGVSALPSTEAGARWMQMLELARGVLQGITKVIDGLRQLIPLVLGSLALLFSRLDDLKLAILGVLEFGLRNALTLRGTLMVTLLDTVSAGARLGVIVLGVLASSVERILASVFDIVGVLLDTALEAFHFLSSGLQRTVDTLLRWATTTLFAVLTTLGDTLVFRAFVYVVRVLPAVLPPLYALVHEKNPLTDEQVKALERASRLAFPATRYTGEAPLESLPPFPGFAPTEDLFQLRSAVTQAGEQITRQAGNILGETQGALTRFGSALNASAAQGEALFTQQLNTKLSGVASRAATLTESLRLDVERGARPSGLELIADAYQGWLTGGGLEHLLGTVTKHFQRTPTAGPGAEGTLPARITEAAQAERPRATVEIRDVIIELAPPPAAAASPVPTALAPRRMSDEEILGAVVRAIHDLEERGITPEASTLLTHLGA
ncbi:hypothetical protein [Myxococcus sp. RHSTA-1-4]|uniref:hypothetical protein n=1 Tax=Myxococcus sp. RHSTA-1-4 TaxID=2874601 RepID=UPI001CBDDAE3|nr:hypothetical protein [Myxococcus sp. RHSTA-1-4]MBZ4417435.1 hypothetical protein [Myxococcus sp. RHSTA-1-4]